FTVQLAQNLLNSLSPVLIFLIAGRLLAWRVAAVAGVLSALSHHLSYYSNVILPDSLSALPLLAAVYVLCRGRRAGPVSTSALILAGVLISISIWLRPNALLIGLFIAILIPLTTVHAGRTLRRAWLVALLPFLLIAPITIRNYLQYGRFVLISANTGIVLVEGIGDARGNPFELPTDDVQVAAREAEIYNIPEYAGTWWHPDLINRDRDRMKTGLGIIVKHPFWYAGVVGHRMLEAFKFSAGAPLVLRAGDKAFLDAGAEAAKTKNGNLIPPQADIDSDRGLPSIGRSLSFIRPGIRIAQRIVKESAQVFLAIGFVCALALSARRTLLLSLVPLYYIVVQSLLHTEFRYTLPIQYFFLVFASITWVLLGWVVWRGISRLSALFISQRVDRVES